MANFANLKAAINAVIKQNGQGEITGEVMNQVLTAMVNSLGSNYQFAGVATPSTNPGTPDQNVFYIATQAGTYTNFSAIVLQAGISILLWDGSWSSETFFTVDDVPTVGSNNLVKSGGVKSYVDNHVGNLSSVFAFLLNKYNTIRWQEGYYLKLAKKFAWQAGWNGALITIPSDCNFISLDIDCSGGATGTFLEDSNGNTLKMWASEFINETIKLSDYPTAYQLRISSRASYDNYLAFITNDSLNNIIIPLVNNGVSYEDSKMANVITTLFNQFADLEVYDAKSYWNDNKQTIDKTSWNAYLVDIPNGCKAIGLNIDCSGGATCSFLEDSEGNTLKMWKTKIIKENIDLSEFPTATKLRFCAKTSYDNAIVFATESVLVNLISVIWERLYNEKLKISVTNWVEGETYDVNKDIISNKNWKRLQIDDFKGVQKISISGVDSTAWQHYSFLLAEDGTTLKSWNSTTINEIIVLSDYPTAKKLLLSSRIAATPTVVMQYDKTLADMYSEFITYKNDLEPTLKGLSNYRMGCVCPIKIKSTDNVLFCGDSITYGQGAGPANIWVNRFCTAVGCSKNNVAVAGAEFSNGQILQQIKSVTLSDYTYIVIAAGINDTNRGRTKSAIETAIANIASYIEGQNFTGHVLWITPANEYRPKDPRSIYTVEQVRRFIYDKAASYGKYYLLDGGGIPYSNLIGDPSNDLLVPYQRDGETIDGLHPNSMGHLMYANYVLTHCANL